MKGRIMHGFQPMVFLKLVGAVVLAVLAVMLLLKL